MTKHPPGLRTLFVTEMWERFSYYGMRAILTLFMLAPIAAGGMGLPKGDSGAIYAMYTSLVYLLSIPGGWLADNIFGQRKSVLYGGIVIMTGHILLAMHGTAMFYAGLGCVILGTGLLKPNISAIVGQLYDRNDVRREAGFSIFYMGINVGAFLAPIACGWLAQSPSWQQRLEGWGLDPRNSWHWGFGAAAVGMFLGLVQYLLTGRSMGKAGLQPAPIRDPEDAARRRNTLRMGVVIGLVLIAGVVILARVKSEWMTKSNINTAYGVFLLLVVVPVFFGRLFLGGNWTRGERNRLVTITVLFAGAAVFWGVFEQAGSTLTIFADQSTRNVIFGYEFPSSWWQFLNALLIIILAPFFAWLWGALGPRNPTYPTKFGIGLVFVGLGFLALVGGAKQWTNIWDEYVAKNKPAIVAAAAQYDVKIPDPDNIRVGVVRKVLATARKNLESSVQKDFEAKNYESIRATGAKYGVTLGSEIGVADVTTVIRAGHAKLGDEILPPWQRISLVWLFFCYLLHTIGELCLSPVGLAAMTRLAPARVVGLMMGVWFLASSVGNYLGGSVASTYDKFELPTLLTAVAGSAFVMALVMFALVVPIKRMLAVSEAEGGARDAAGH